MLVCVQMKFTELIVCTYMYSMCLFLHTTYKTLVPAWNRTFIYWKLYFYFISLQLLITWRPAKNSVISYAERRGWGRERRVGRSVRSWSSSVREEPALWNTSRRGGRSSPWSWRRWEGHQRSVGCGLGVTLLLCFELVVHFPIIIFEKRITGESQLFSFDLHVHV